MRLLYGEGVLVAVLAPLVLLLVGAINPLQTLFLGGVLFGLWTVAFAIAWAGAGQKIYYLGWGIVVAALATIAEIPVRYSLAIVIVAIIGLIVYSAVTRKSRSELKARTPQTTPENKAGSA
jgi:FtsH-binding integral membrane protein